MSSEIKPRITAKWVKEYPYREMLDYRQPVVSLRVRRVFMRKHERWREIWTKKGLVSIPFSLKRLAS